MPKPSKSERKEERLQSVEQELANVKRKNVELQQQKMVRLNDEQIQKFLDELTQRIEWATNRVIDEIPRSIPGKSQEQPKSDGISYFLKCLIAIPFFVVTVAIIYSLYNVWGDFWNAGWSNRLALLIVAVAGFDCAALGVEILKEKDRNYIVSLFSALVALVALIVTLVK